MISALPIFAMIALKLLKRFFTTFNKIHRSFVWGKEENDATGGKCKVAWAKVCSPQDYGGIGIPNMEACSRALHLRGLLWQPLLI